MNNQRITTIILVLVSSLLLFEYIRGSRSNDNPSNEDPTSEEVNKSPQDTIPKLSVADSIVQAYAPAAFKREQLEFPRVKTAYKEKQSRLDSLYEEKGLDPEKLNIYLRAFKKEKLIEVWAKNEGDPAYKMFSQFAFCKSSGTLGPKRKEGDKQIPEGFYRLVGFNPNSKYYLSLKINYPNRSDKVLGDTSNLGDDIFIHGNCVTVGCIPITDDKIKELYLLAIDAKSAGQKRIPVSIFPVKLSDENFEALKKEFAGNLELLNLWKNLKDGYQFFNECKKLPVITITSKGDYICKSDCK